MVDELKVYELEVGGVPHTFQLTAEEAERRGAKLVSKAAPKPKNKARTAVPNKSTASSDKK